MVERRITPVPGAEVRGDQQAARNVLVVHLVPTPSAAEPAWRSYFSAGVERVTIEQLTSFAMDQRRLRLARGQPDFPPDVPYGVTQRQWGDDTPYGCLRE